MQKTSGRSQLLIQVDIGHLPGAGLSQYDARSGRELGATSRARHESLLASACALVDVWPIYLGRLPPAARPERDGKVFCERPHTNSRCRGLDFYPYPSSRWIGRPSGFKIRWAAAALVVFCLGTGFGVHLVAGDFNNMIHFYKNLVMAGGFLYVMTYGAGAMSIDGAE